MGMKIKVTYSDGRVVESKVSPRAEVDFERRFGVSILAAGRDMHQEYYYYLAWAGLHFAGKEPADFDAFLGLINDAENVKDEEAQLPEDPTRQAPQPEPSSS